MSWPKPLQDPAAARATLAHRLARRTDRIRQLATKFGVRSRRVFLVWVQSTGEAAGAGSDVVLARRELLPTPRVTDATAITRRPLTIGIVPDGSVRVDQISCGAYTEDNLRGRKIPVEYSDPRDRDHYPGQRVAGTALAPVVREPTVFFYEIVEDGRGDDPPERTRYKLGVSPWRNESGMQWGIMLEPMGGALNRAGNPTGMDDDVLDV